MRDLTLYLKSNRVPVKRSLVDRFDDLGLRRKAEEDQRAYLREGAERIMLQKARTLSYDDLPFGTYDYNLTLKAVKKALSADKEEFTGDVANIFGDLIMDQAAYLRKEDGQRRKK